LAFTSDADGNESIYVLQLSDHKLVRVTHQVYGSQLCGWTPDGNLLFMTSAFVPNYQGDWRQLFIVSPNGGLPVQVPLTQAADGAVSPDGSLIAFTEYANRFLPWKQNYGGLASDLWIFDRAAQKATKITDWKGTDTFPMWHEKTLFYVSDEGAERTMNLWRIEPSNGKRRQLTHFSDFDIDDPSIGPDEIVFQKGGALFSYDIAHDRSAPIDITIPLQEHHTTISAGDHALSASPLDNGQVVFESVGDIFITEPTGKNPKNLTNTDAVAERNPVPSPDGTQIAYASDAAGEYNLETIPVAGGPPTRITRRTRGFLSKPCWSPDSQHIAFSDNAGQLYVCLKDGGQPVEADRDEWNRALHPCWSPDSKYLVYAKTERTMMQSLWLYDLSATKSIRLTAGRSKDDWPSFDRKGDYLFYSSGRDLRGRTFDSIEYDNFVYPNIGALMAMPLRKDLPMPWGVGGASASKQGIDLDDIERRAAMMNQAPTNVSDIMTSASSNLLYIDWTGSAAALKTADFKQVRSTQKLERTILPNTESYTLSPNGSKILVRRGGGYVLLDVESKDAPEQAVDLSGAARTIDEQEAWKQVFADAWRFCRDYFYDKGMNGVDWSAVRVKYQPLVERCSARSELDYVMSQMVGELHSSHCSIESVPSPNHKDERSGTLGVDFELSEGAYRITHIYDSPAWDAVARSVLRRPGLNVQEGAYLLAVNGKPVDVTQDPWFSLLGTAQAPTRLTIGSKPAVGPDSRDIVVVPYADDTYVRGRAWIEEKRLYVSKKSGDRIGYIFFPDTLNYGADAFVRQFYNEFRKDALIIDDRWNGGGRTPERFIEILQRQPSWKGVRQNTLAPTGFVHAGPKCMVINGASKSGGDSLPALFKLANLGKLIGTPTMGARGGSGGPEPPAFVDGGRISVPHIGFKDAAGNWSLGDRGVQPDIWVENDPANGDIQLDAAIEWMQKELKR
jgi:tricorn protease